MLPDLSIFKAHWRALAVFVAVFLAFAVGRFATPAKVVVQTKTQTVEKIVQAKAEVRTETQVVYRDRTVVTHKDGTVEHRNIEQTSNGQVDTKHESAEKVVYRDRELLRVVESPKPQWRVGVLAGVDILHLGRPQLFGPVALGAHVERRIAGPVWLGAFGLSSGAAGVSVSVEF